jgi:hypothetical protein
MDDIVLTRVLRAQGLNTADLTRMSRDGELTRVRRGAYSHDPGEDLGRDERHRRLVLATAPLLLDGSVVHPPSVSDCSRWNGGPAYAPPAERSASPTSAARASASR